MKILHLISSPRGEASVSRKLGNAIVEKLEAAYPDSTVKTHDLTADAFPHLGAEQLHAFFTPIESRTPELAEIASPSDNAVADLKEADVIVIGAPMYNFTIHSSLKAWIDHIVRAGVTFAYSEAGPQGLVKDKKVYLAISSGGVYSEGPYKAGDFIDPYLRFMLGFLGMTNIETVRAEGLNVPELRDTALEKAIASVTVELN